MSYIDRLKFLFHPILDITITYRVSRPATWCTTTTLEDRFFLNSLCQNLSQYFDSARVYIYIYTYTLLYEIIGISVSFRESVIRNPLVIPQASSASNECARQSTLFKKRWNRIRPLVKISKHHFFKHGGGELRQFQPFPSPNEPLELTIRLLAATHHFSHPPINFSRIQIYE